jgi:anaerobic selenocysteine-containing dehydrogenase
MRSLLARVENGRVVRIDGDPAQPFTAGFACDKVNRDVELVHSPERLATPLRRVAKKGEGRFAPISWDGALDEIAARWRVVIDDDDLGATLSRCLGLGPEMDIGGDEIGAQATIRSEWATLSGSAPPTGPTSCPRRSRSKCRRPCRRAADWSAAYETGH